MEHVKLQYGDCIGGITCEKERESDGGQLGLGFGGELGSKAPAFVYITVRRCNSSVVVGKASVMAVGIGQPAPVGEEIGSKG